MQGLSLKYRVLPLALKTLYLGIGYYSEYRPRGQTRKIAQVFFIFLSVIFNNNIV